MGLPTTHWWQPCRQVDKEKGITRAKDIPKTGKEDRRTRAANARLSQVKENNTTQTKPNKTKPKPNPNPCPSQIHVPVIPNPNINPDRITESKFDPAKINLNESYKKKLLHLPTTCLRWSLSKQKVPRTLSTMVGRTTCSRTTLKTWMYDEYAVNEMVAFSLREVTSTLERPRERSFQLGVFLKGTQPYNRDWKVLIPRNWYWFQTIFGCGLNETSRI